jgi:hypothetical protein
MRALARRLETVNRAAAEDVAALAAACEGPEQREWLLMCEVMRFRAFGEVEVSALIWRAMNGGTR